MVILLKLATLSLVIFWAVRKIRQFLSARKQPAAKPTADAPAETSSQRVPGRHLMLVSASCASVAIVLGWVGGAWMALRMMPLLLLWAYPVMTAQLHWHVHAGLAKLRAGLVMVSGLVVMALLFNLPSPDAYLSAAGLVAAVYLLCGLAFTVGVLTYAKAWSFNPGDGKAWLRFNVPEGLAVEFNTAFTGQNQDELVAGWMREAILRSRHADRGAVSQTLDAKYSLAIRVET